LPGKDDGRREALQVEWEAGPQADANNGLSTGSTCTAVADPRSCDEYNDADDHDGRRAAAMGSPGAAGWNPPSRPGPDAGGAGLAPPNYCGDCVDGKNKERS
jgi:hypothetical protein